jgi:hypothetical protein
LSARMRRQCDRHERAQDGNAHVDLVETENGTDDG